MPVQFGAIYRPVPVNPKTHTGKEPLLTDFDSGPCTGLSVFRPAFSGNKTDAPKENPVFTIETEKGTIKGVLFQDAFPGTVKNFMDLVKSGFYNLGLEFHRVVEDYIIQTGNAESVGQEKPPSIPLETHPDHQHDKAGILAMARQEDPDTATSQFYITMKPIPNLDTINGGYAAFGEVQEGLEVVSQIEQGDKLLNITIEEPVETNDEGRKQRPAKI